LDSRNIFKIKLFFQVTESITIDAFIIEVQNLTGCKCQIELKYGNMEGTKTFNEMDRYKTLGELYISSGDYKVQCPPGVQHYGMSLTPEMPFETVPIPTPSVTNEVTKFICIITSISTFRLHYLNWVTAKPVHQGRIRCNRMLGPVIPYAGHQCRSTGFSGFHKLSR
jgi:hypothetical protein